MGTRAPTGIVLADTDGVIAWWSAGAEQLLGYAPAEAVGHPLDLIVPEAHRTGHWAGFQRAMETGVCRLDRGATNLPVLHRDGSERVLPARFVFLTDARDAAVGAMAIYAEPVGGEEPWGAILPRGVP